jgi:hypothetical protein
MQQQEALTAAERIKRQQLNQDTRMALAAGLSLDEFLKEREALSSGWASFIYQEMSKLRADDPTEVLPSICARLEQRAAQTAREAARAEAKAQVATMLRKAITS